MGFLGWWVAFAFAGTPGSDVVAERVVAATPTEVSDYLSRLDQVSAVFPEDCAQDWIVGPTLRAPDATGEVVVRAALLKRRREASLASQALVLVLDVSRPVLLTALHDAALTACELDLPGPMVREQCRWQCLWPLAWRQGLASPATDALLSVFPICRPKL